MHWPPDIADDLPAPRDDEPSSLRQDIADELADHLQCAFTRELHLTRDEQAAQQQALDRFGDPRAVARKLWFDALRENIMSQRLTIVALGIVLVTSLASSAATWFLVSEAQNANIAMLAQSRAATDEILARSRDANKALIEQNEKANAALIEKLGQLPAGTPQAAESQSLEWNPVKVRLYSGEKPGIPAAGFSIALVGHVLDTSKSVTISRTTDEAGMADFGLVRPGQHSLRISAPWGEKPNDQPLYVLPGKAVSEEIPCPAADIPNANLQFDVDWPEDLKARGCWLVCQLVQTPRNVGGRDWTKLPRAVNQFVLLGPESQLVPFPIGPDDRLVLLDDNQRSRGDNQTFHSWPFHGISSLPFSLRGLHAEWNLHLSPAYRKLVSESRNTTSSQFQLADQLNFVFGNIPAIPHIEIAATEWRLEGLLICDKPAPVSQNDAWAIATGRNFGFGDRQVAPVENLDEESKADLSAALLLGGFLPNVGLTPGISNRVPNLQTPIFRTLSDWDPPGQNGTQSANHAARPRVQPRFVAEAGKGNVWKIRIPESLLERVRNNPEFKSAEPEAKAPDAPTNDDR